MRKTHDLKCHSEYFKHVKDGSKPFELRRDDRDFEVGDLLNIDEVVLDYDSEILFTGNREVRLITYILREGVFGLKEGWAILGLAKPL